MQQNLPNDLELILGDRSFFDKCENVKVRKIFDAAVIDFLDIVSKKLLSDKDAKGYSDIVTFAFWIRKASLSRYMLRYRKDEKDIVVGKGIIFHVAPSNVAMNFAYSLVAGLLAGNINIVRIPSKVFPQTDIVVRAMKEAIKENREIGDYICLVKYGHNTAINDLLSGLSDVRVVWGGNDTIAVFRQSPLKPRATEILFANRFSLAVVDSDEYIKSEDKDKIALDFYNDTYLMDQNACSSPKIVIWTGKEITDAKIIFWNELHKVIKIKYDYQQIQGVNKYLDACLTASKLDKVRIEPSVDNLITRVSVGELDERIIDCFGNSGFFLEYDTSDLSDIRRICNDNKCQTITYYGDVKMFDVVEVFSLKGVDRIVPFGKSMDFNLIWDGYDLIAHLSRIISIRTK